VQVQAAGARLVVAALVVLGQNQRVAVVELLEMLRRQPVPELTILDGEQAVRGVAQKRVAKAILRVGGIAAVALHLDQLGLDQALKPAIHVDGARLGAQ
jgi:hypothetical protein